MISDPIKFERFKNSLFSVADEVALTIFPDALFLRAEGQRGLLDRNVRQVGGVVTQGLTLPPHYPRRLGHQASRGRCSRHPERGPSKGLPAHRADRMPIGTRQCPDLALAPCR